ncbi:transcriptional regulator, AraC family [Streptococcus criceti HS-6]|uniref:Transcriptional regulator, AraC family n=1 Tax=Streptococcus criceti HS-6 TaxID=873449 RepID=G5JMI7_STRCG|nr:AraC family transcriptional regulator [Streptococcus criceti]EHI74705.1 transcriptional regulator, AraC family [Streptococcus criceti HS-6]
MMQAPSYIRDDPSGFPYEFYQTHLVYGQPEIMYHWHPELEISYISMGKGIYHINDEAFDCQTGAIMLIQPNAMHSIQPASEQELISDTFSIHLDNLGRSIIDKYSQRYLQPLHNGHFKLTPRIQPSMIGYQAIKDCLFEIFELVSQQSLYFDMLLKSKCHELLYLLFKYRYINRHYTDNTYQNYQKLKELIDYINEHYAEHLTISFLADYFGYSRTHFMSIFKQHTGSSCLEFILQVRLNRACELLLQTNHSIQDITSQVGFANQSNFNRQFKKYYKLTPRQYRQEFTKGSLRK